MSFISQSRTGVLAAVRAGIGVGIIPTHSVEDDLLVIREELPPLPETEVTLFIAANVNEATRRLEAIIEENPLFRIEESQ